MINMDEYYTASQAAEVLSKNSGKNIDPSYVRKLARPEYNILHPLHVAPRYHLYPRSEVDAYVVEDRGKKAARAKKMKSVEASIKSPTSLSD